MSAPNESKFTINFEQELPPWNYFPVHYLANEWHCTPDHIINLIETGELPTGIDLRGHKGSRRMLRVPRKALVEFLNQRKDLAAVAAANPRPKTRQERLEAKRLKKAAGRKLR